MFKVFYHLILLFSLNVLEAATAYITSSDTNIYVFDTDTQSFDIPINLGISSQGIAATEDGRFIYVCCPTINQVVCIDVAHPEDKIFIPVDQGPVDIKIALINGTPYAYVVNSGSNTVSVINLLTNGVDQVISLYLKPINNSFTPNSIAIDSLGDYAYVGTTNLKDSSFPSYIETIDLVSNTVIGAFNVKYTIDQQPVKISSNSFVTGDSYLYLCTLTDFYGYSRVLVFKTHQNTYSTLQFSGTGYAGSLQTSIGLRQINLINDTQLFVSAFPKNADPIEKIYSFTFDPLNPFFLTLSGQSGQVVDQNPSCLGIVSDDTYVYACGASGTLLRSLKSDILANTGVIPSQLKVENNSNAILQQIIIAPTYSPDPPFPPTAPQGIKASSIKNNFGIDYEWSNVIMWGLSPNYVLGYYIYKNGKRIATVSNSTSSYEDHDVKKGLPIVYSITSFSADGSESVPISLTIK